VQRHRHHAEREVDEAIEEIVNQTRPIRAIHRSDGWTPEALVAQLKGAFGPSFTPLDRSGDVFSWDPI
jgi:hypothetical protein